MTRFKRPNPDAWHIADVAFTKEFDGGEVRLELWENKGDQQWVFVVSDGGPSHKEQFAPVTDGMMAMMLRVMVE